MNEFGNLTVVIKTLLRYCYLSKTVESFHVIDPSIQILIVDDSPISARQDFSGPFVKHIFTEEDIGVSAGRNRGFQLAETDYILYTDDDDYPLMTREELLENFNFVVNGNADLVGFKGADLNIRDDNKTIEVIRREITGFQKVDLTSNSFISSRRLLLDNPFFEPVKNHGEHCMFFYHLKLKNARVFSSESFRFHASVGRNPAYREFRQRNFRHLAIQNMGYTPIWRRNNAS